MSLSESTFRQSNSNTIGTSKSTRYSLVSLTICAAIFGLLALAAQAQDFCIEASTSYATGSSPEAVAAADLNGDGHTDLIVANYGSYPDTGSVSVLIGNGDGTFASAANYVTGYGPQAVSAADIDGDGDRDLVVACLGNPNDHSAHPGGVTILNNNGNGTFAAGVYHDAGSRPNSVIAADLSGDGDIDLAVTNYDSGMVSILVNNGNGNFSSPLGYPTGAQPSSVVAVDLDADGDTDLAVANLGCCVSILKNNGDGTFASAANYLQYGLCFPSSVFADDLDGDGDLDLAVACYYYDYSGVSVLRNNGDGDFSTAQGFAAGSFPRSSVIAADFTGDGNFDLAVGSGSGISVLENTGGGTFGAPTSYGVVGGPTSVIAADFDEDGSFDLAATSRGAVSVLINKGTGDLRSARAYGVGYNPRSVVTAYLNGDDDPDIAVAYWGDGNVYNDLGGVVVLTSSGIGSYASPRYYDAGSHPVSIAAANLDGDGYVDLTVANSSGISVLKNFGGGTFGAPTNYSDVVGRSVVSVCATDLDGDGDVDLAGLSPAGPGARVTIFKNDGAGSFTALVSYAVGAGIPRSVIAADLDGDGDLDLTIAKGGGVSVLMNYGDGTFATPLNYATGLNPWSVTAVDLDADLDLDLVVANNGSNNVSVLKNDGEGSFAAPAIYAAGRAPSSVIAADLNGDSHLDLVVSNYSDGGLSALKNYGDGTFSAPVSYDAGGVYPICLAAADLGVKGNLDLIVANAASSNVAILTNCGFGVPVVSTLDDFGPGSLRAAITSANANPGQDTIVFTVAGVIQPLSPLPVFSDASGGTVILGFTAPGAVSPNAPTVILDGSNSNFTWPAGILIESSHNRIEGLTIRNFAGAGVAVTGASSVSNTITGCTFSRNGAPGIDLWPRGTTPNDPGDTDAGPNTLVNFPLFDSVFQVAGDTFTVFGTAAPLSRVELFLAAESGNPELQPEGTDHGPAHLLLGWTITDASGEFKLDSIVKPEWSLITATATDTLGNTSEFSQNKYLTPDPLWITAYSEALPVGGLKAPSALSPAMKVTVFSPPDSAGQVDSIGPSFNTFGPLAKYDSLTDWDGGGLPDARVWISSPDTGHYRIVFGLIGDPGSYLTGIGIDAHAEVQKRIAFSGYGLLPMGPSDSTIYHLAPPMRGELNEDWVIDVFDVVNLIDVVYAGAPMPDPLDLGDVNCDKATDLADIVYLIAYAFQNGPPPCQ